MSQFLAGCKRKSEVRQYFEHNDKTNKSSHLVQVESNGNNNPCRLQLDAKNPTNLKVKWSDLNIFLRRYRVMTSIDSLWFHTELGCHVHRRDTKVYANTVQGCTDILGHPTTIVRPVDTFVRRFNCCASTTCLYGKNFLPVWPLNCRTQKQNEPEPGDEGFVKLNNSGVSL